MFYPTELSTDEYLNDQVIWADYGDYAEDTWNDGYEIDDVAADANTLASAGWGTDEDYPYPTQDAYLDSWAEDAYLDSYWESLTEM